MILFLILKRGGYVMIITSKFNSRSLYPVYDGSKFGNALKEKMSKKGNKSLI